MFRDVEILFASGEEQVHQRDSRGQTELERPDWDGLDLCRGGAAHILAEGLSKWSRQEIHACREGGHTGNWCERRRCRGEGEMKEDESLR